MFENTQQVRYTDVRVHIGQRDINESDCLDRRRCMIRNGTERALRLLDPSVSHHHTQVDAGHIKANINGYACKADLPIRGKAALIMFDKEDKARRAAARAGVPFISAVKPFSMTLRFVRGERVRKFTRERQEQINAARRLRKAAGIREKVYTLRERIVGFA
jgi:hypothetical protein